MPDSDPASHSDPSAAAPSEKRNLPVPVPQPPSSDRKPANGWLTRIIRLIFNWRADSIRADLKVVLEAPPGETGFSPTESAMLKNILGLHERKIENVMVPRADIVAVQQDIPLGELLRVFERASHSRLVVYNDTLDDPVGMVHIRDLIAFMMSQAAVNPHRNARRKKPLPAGLDLKAIDLARPLSATRIVRQILFVPPSMPATDLLAKMQATRIHLSLVIDEYGGTDGLVSIEDLVELIVGDIADEHDEYETPTVFRQSDGSFIADARTSLEEVTATIGPEFDVGEEGKDVDTLGGYLMTKAGRLPVRGELVPGPLSFEFEVLDADPRRLKRIRIYRRKDRRPAALPREARPRASESEQAAPSPAPPAPPPAEQPSTHASSGQQGDEVASQRAARRP
jgi:CBS domain containing-hemolysin-like protein